MTLFEKKIEKICDCWKSGLKINQIASILNLSRNTVKKYLRERVDYRYQPVNYSSCFLNLNSRSQITYPSYGDNGWSYTGLRHDNTAYYYQPEGEISYAKLLSNYNELTEKYIELERWIMRLMKK